MIKAKMTGLLENKGNTGKVKRGELRKCDNRWRKKGRHKRRNIESTEQGDEERVERGGEEMTEWSKHEKEKKLRWKTEV